ncbi:hypothetical protein BC941DRAFT_438920 [Chlamydoabsidia padenii]|nr:hypothetical protein BC941DRAFT_438920 [Chlamydoabsidia padenii]
MVFPTVSYSTKLTLRKSTPPTPSSTSSISPTKKQRPSHAKIGPRSAPNRSDRIAAYERAFQRCIQKDSKLASWKQRMDEKGLPSPLIEGYQRSSTSWQHSLSSLSSDSSSTSSSDARDSRTMKRFDIKPMRSITITSSSPSSAPMPKPSVSRRIINRLSLSITSKAVKVAPSATQSLRRHSHQSGPPHHFRCQYHYPMSPPVMITPLPAPSLPRIHPTTQSYHYHPHSHYGHPQQQTSRFLQRSLDRSLQPVNTTTIKKNTILPPSPPSSPCSVDEPVSLKRYIGTPSQHCPRQKVVAK